MIIVVIVIVIVVVIVIVIVIVIVLVIVVALVTVFALVTSMITAPIIVIWLRTSTGPRFFEPSHCIHLGDTQLMSKNANHQEHITCTYTHTHIYIYTYICIGNVMERNVTKLNVM